MKSDSSAHFVSQLRRELHCQHDVLYHTALTLSIGIGDNPEWRTWHMLGFSMRPVLQQCLLITGKVDSGTTMQRFSCLSKRLRI